MMVSVIIPVMNPGTCLRPCMESVLGQKLGDIEVICVDDGCTDGSSEVLREYAAADARVKVVDGPRQGPGMARNAGLEIARGRYLAFADSDDLVTPDIWSAAVAYAERDSLDMVLFNAREFCDATGEEVSNPWADLSFPDTCFGGVFTWREMRCNPFAVCCYLPCRVVRRDFWGELRFPGLHIGEDAVAHASLVTRASRIGALRERLYEYRRREGSVTKSCAERIFDHMAVADMVYRIWRESPCAEELADDFYEYTGRLLMQVLRTAPGEDARRRVREWAEGSFLAGSGNRLAHRAYSLFTTRLHWLFRLRWSSYERLVARRVRKRGER